MNINNSEKFFLKKNKKNDFLWGEQTEKALKYFNISNEKLPHEMIYALVLIKYCAAKVNSKLGLINKKIANAIIQASEEILFLRKHKKEFPILIWQSGSGTQSNMNVNEVLANRANQILKNKKHFFKKVHPNDDVNKSQSSNDVFPSAMNISIILMLRKKLIPNLKNLINLLSLKSKKFKNVIKIGRTHLQDAIPLTFGQEISGWISTLKNNLMHIKKNIIFLKELALGGTAIGTGLNAHPRYAFYVTCEISNFIGESFKVAKNYFELISTSNVIVNIHSALKNLAISLIKISNDIRWLSSGPHCGIGEIFIPNNEPGSSIMPGKVNPTQCEAMIMLCYQIFGNDLSISIGSASGNFQLNTFRPMIIYNCLKSIHLLSDGIKSFSRYCIKGINVNHAKIDNFLKKSLMLVTALTPYIGYKKSEKIALMAYKKNLSLKEAVLKLNYLTEKEFDAILNIKNMIKNS